MPIHLRRLRGPAVAVATVAVLISTAGTALADDFDADGDQVAPANTVLALGGASSVCPGDTLTSSNARLILKRNGSATGPSTFGANQTLMATAVGSVSYLTSTSATLQLGDWPSASNNTQATFTAPTVTLTVPSDGTTQEHLTYTVSGVDASASRSAIEMTAVLQVRWTLGSDCTTPTSGDGDATPPADTTAPDVTYSLTSDTDPVDGWYTSPVSIDWAVSDPESAVTSSGCDAVTQSDDTAGATYTCTATSAGGTTQKSVTVKVDKTPPVVTYSLDPATPDSGWYDGPVAVTWNAADDVSGIGSSTGCGSVTQSAETDGTTYTCTATNGAGESTTVTTTPIRVDETAPTITSTNLRATYDFGDPIPAATCDATDALSGVNDAGCAVTGAVDTSVGRHTLTATATDVAGNTEADDVTYDVAAWDLSGFFKPVDMGRVLNSEKAGSTVPLKFRAYRHDAGTEITSDLGASFAAQPVDCTTLANTGAAVPLASAGATVLRYDAGGDQWIYNWATPASAARGTCYRASVVTADGSSIAAYFQMK